MVSIFLVLSLARELFLDTLGDLELHPMGDANGEVWKSRFGCLIGVDGLPEQLVRLEDPLKWYMSSLPQKKEDRIR